MADFNYVKLHRAKPVVALTVSEGKLEIEQGEVNVTEWIAFKTRVDALLKGYNLLPKDKPTTPTVLGNNFLYSNGQAIFETKRGKLVRAPFWLRWFCDKVVTKENLKDYD